MSNYLEYEFNPMPIKKEKPYIKIVSDDPLAKHTKIFVVDGDNEIDISSKIFGFHIQGRVNSLNIITLDARIDKFELVGILENDETKTAAKKE